VWAGCRLHAAVVNNNGQCIKELIKADADPHIPNKEGKTALKMVEEKSPQLLTFFDKNTNALRGNAPHTGPGGPVCVAWPPPLNVPLFCR